MDMQQLSFALSAIGAEGPAACPAALDRPVDPAADQVITDCMKDVARAVARAARTASPMPNNPELGRLAGGRGRSTAYRMLQRLVSAGELRMEVLDKRRRCQVVSTGAWTDWGTARPGHAPYLHRKRGDAAPTTSQRQRAPESRPMAARPMFLSPSLPAPAADYRLMGEIASCAANCQFPVWRDGARPGSKPVFCEAVSSSGSSYCPEHTALVYPNRKPTAAAPPRRRGPLGAAVVLHDLEAGQDVAGDRIYTTEALLGLPPGP